MAQRTRVNEFKYFRVLAIIVLINPSSPAVATCSAFPLTVDLTPSRWFCSGGEDDNVKTLITIFKQFCRLFAGVCVSGQWLKVQVF